MQTRSIEIIDKVGGGPVHLVGHSMGTLVCQHVAARRPECVKSAALFGPIVDPAEAARQRLRERARDARQDGMIGIADAAAVGGTSSTSRNANPLLAPFVRESHMRQDPEGFAQTCEALADATAADLRFLRCPTLIVTGDEDAVAPPSAAQALADRIKGSKLKILEHCGHWTPFERPRRLRAAAFGTRKGARNGLTARGLRPAPSRGGLRKRRNAMADEYNGTNGSGGVVFTNVRILDGTGEYPYTGEVTVQGNRIKQVTKGSSRLSGGSSAWRPER